MAFNTGSIRSADELAKIYATTEDAIDAQEEIAPKTNSVGNRIRMMLEREQQIKQKEREEKERVLNLKKAASVRIEKRASFRRSSTTFGGGSTDTSKNIGSATDDDIQRADRIRSRARGLQRSNTQIPTTGDKSAEEAETQRLAKEAEARS
eukprot:TRINITY_DN775_c0_g1_i8.p1 TRINITY_DN775_c0_g1~~TRINITY_DN775_c0_g1_i8.p1  ORF type:complete len:151 (-),score=44.79 TRINITY_DN775_c0_g1_i8:305-757(-)